MTTPILYLDVDGVLCPHRVPDESIDDFGDWVMVPNSYDVPWSPAMIELINALVVERRWLTSWQHEANERLSPLFGWEQLPVLEHRPGSLWWKFDALVQNHPRGTPFIWIDDELDTQRAALEGMFEAGLRTLEAPYLSISTWAHRGITRDDIARISDFLDDPYRGLSADEWFPLEESS
jgi:hypothetical protein